MLDYYHGLTKEQISPHEWPARKGELTILLVEKVGYCAIVKDISKDKSYVSLLDHIESDPLIEIPLNACIPTRKTPLNLISIYQPTSLSMSEALSIERSFPDFNAPQLAKSRKKGGSKSGGSKKKIKALTKEELMTQLLTLDENQKKALGILFKQMLKKETLKNECLSTNSR